MTIHTLNLKSQTTHPVRTLANVYLYEGEDADRIMRDLLNQRFTGPITLNVSAGRVRSIEWREKIHSEPASQNSP